MASFLSAVVFRNTTPSTCSPTKMRAMSPVLYHLGLPGISSVIRVPLMTRFLKHDVLYFAGLVVPGYDGGLGIFAVVSNVLKQYILHAPAGCRAVFGIEEYADVSAIVPAGNLPPGCSQNAHS
jgi:hypothetical protein